MPMFIRFVLGKVLKARGWPSVMCTEAFLPDARTGVSSER
jgi:hypothetical protein